MVGGGIVIEQVESRPPAPSSVPREPGGDLGTGDPAALAVRGLAKAYGGTRVLSGVDLDVPAGSITAILGASGSGKTTLLRVIAGFEGADAGTVSIGGRLVDDGSRAVRPQRRGIGYVPQDSLLFPHLTVAGNIGFGLRGRRRRRERVPALLELVGLVGYGQRYPHQLSGGQQQRVALARALAVRPAVVLLDEPFGALDATLRETVRADVARILAATGSTTILVTHDQDEALAFADRIAVLGEGRIVARGTPQDLYERPDTETAALAIGTANILLGRRAEGRITHLFGECAAPAPAPGASSGGPGARLLLRPESLRVHAAFDPNHPRRPDAEIVRLRYHGHDTLLDLALRPAGPSREGHAGPAGEGAGGHEGTAVLTARITAGTVVSVGQTVWLSAPDDLPVLPDA